MVTAETKSPAPVDNSILKQVLPTSDSEPTTYKANCHCGAVRYEVTLKDPFPKYPINKCSCTICTKNGYLLVYPTRSDVVFTRGNLNYSDHCCSTAATSLEKAGLERMKCRRVVEMGLVSNANRNKGYDYLAGYRFGTKKKVHKFCKACGSSILIDFMRPEQGIEDPTKDILAVNVCFLSLIPRLSL